MKLIEKPKMKTLWIALAVVVGLLAVTSGSYAAYNSQDVQRGVARNRDTDAIRFTSNYLKPSSSDSEENYPGKVIGYSKNTVADATLIIEIYVYNYVVGSNSQVNEKDITYNMSIQLKDGTGNDSEYRVTDNAGNQLTADTNRTYKTRSTLVGRTARADHYTVQIPGKDLDKIKIIAKAEPVNKSYTGNKFLAAVIAPCTASTVQSFSCTGAFTDSGNGKPADYDAFNYEVSISGGQAKVTLSWRSDVVEIDPFFLEKIGKSKTNLTSSGDMTSLTYTMDQTSGTGDYLIPFYRKSTNDTLPVEWTNMKDVISVTGEQSISTN